MVKIQKIIQKVKNLAPIPVVIHKVLDFASKPDGTLDDLVRLVENDPAITANLLKSCNSAHMGLPVKVNSVQQAVTLLGIQKVVEIVVTQTLSVNLQKAQEGYGLAKGELWKQSVATAMVARNLAERRQLPLLPTIYTGALLKDIGKVVLHEFVADELQKIEYQVNIKGYSFIEAEHLCIGMDHATLGGIIAEEWSFSDQMVFMIRHHHLLDPEARKDPATATLYLADMVSMMVGTCTGIDRLAYKVYENIFSDFFLAKDELKALMYSYDGYLTGAQRFLEN
ncbi:MAG: HDOD domain-containing protein [Desulfobacteraceae bacterium]|jgi:HD-like signal output (HDOD) protein